MTDDVLGRVSDNNFSGVCYEVMILMCDTEPRVLALAWCAPQRLSVSWGRVRRV